VCLEPVSKKKNIQYENKGPLKDGLYFFSMAQWHKGSKAQRIDSRRKTQGSGIWISIHLETCLEPVISLYVITGRRLPVAARQKHQCQSARSKRQNIVDFVYLPYESG